MVRLEQDRDGDREILRALEADFPYMALDTCAVDGLCATACPVSINTGDLTKRFRRLRHPEWAQNVACVLAKRFAFVEPTMRLGRWMGHATQSLLGAGMMVGMTRAIRTIIRQPFPQWSREMPRPASGRPPLTQKAGAHAVYFPACISRVMGHLPGEPDGMSLMEAFVAVARRAGQSVWIPENVEGYLQKTTVKKQDFMVSSDVSSDKN